MARIRVESAMMVCQTAWSDFLSLNDAIRTPANRGYWQSTVQNRAVDMVSIRLMMKWRRDAPPVMACTPRGRTKGDMVWAVRNQAAVFSGLVLS